eukprot:6487614-Amphidinium_carterae.1
MKAYEEYKHMLALDGIVEAPQELDKAMEKASTQARATKATGCLVHMLVHESDPVKLRSSVQAELKELRAHVGKQEQSLLNKVIWARVQSVLKGSG